MKTENITQYEEYMENLKNINENDFAKTNGTNSEADNATEGTTDEPAAGSDTGTEGEETP